ncbi:MAG TPA: hypothetical protein PKK61_00455 [Defluviitaleaceae bacterium]|nr:hypothetical protein [Defluviitaleaceae bacterium]
MNSKIKYYNEKYFYYYSEVDNVKELIDKKYVKIKMDKLFLIEPELLY